MTPQQLDPLFVRLNTILDQSKQRLGHIFDSLKRTALNEHNLFTRQILDEIRTSCYTAQLPSQANQALMNTTIASFSTVVEGVVGSTLDNCTIAQPNEQNSTNSTSAVQPNIHCFAQMEPTPSQLNVSSKNRVQPLAPNYTVQNIKTEIEENRTEQSINTHNATESDSNDNSQCYLDENCDCYECIKDELTDTETNVPSNETAINTSQINQSDSSQADSLQTGQISETQMSTSSQYFTPNVGSASDSTPKSNDQGTQQGDPNQIDDELAAINRSARTTQKKRYRKRLSSTDSNSSEASNTSNWEPPSSKRARTENSSNEHYSDDDSSDFDYSECHSPNDDSTYDKSVGSLSDSDQSDCSSKQAKTKRVLLKKTHKKADDISKYYTIQRLYCIAEKCKTSVPSSQLLYEHLEKEHGISKYRCLVQGCARSFGEGKSLGCHIRTAHRKPVYKCSKCLLTFPDHAGLQLHIQRVHNKGQFECSHDKCNFVATTRLDVLRHYKGTHGEYSCPFEGCGLSFSCATVLRNHERIHRGARPYRCKWPGCKTDSTQKSYINQHVRMVHFGLPASKKKQDQLGIVDNRDPSKYVQVIKELL